MRHYWIIAFNIICIDFDFLHLRNFHCILNVGQMISCSWKSTVGIECFMCGFQRSFLLLLKGELYESFILFPALIPLLSTFILLGIHLYFDWKNGAKWITFLFSISAVLMLISFSFKLPMLFAAEHLH